VRDSAYRRRQVGRLIGRASIAAMHVVATVAAAVLGAGVGTLLSLPTYRLSVPAGSAPAAACRHCRAPLPAGGRGWIGRGTCRSCGNPFASARRYYVVVTAVAFALLGWRLPHRSLGEDLLLAAWLVFAGAGRWLAAIDLHVHRLPTKIIGGAAAACGSLIAVAALVGHRPWLAADAGIAALAVGLAYLAMALLAPGQLGMGDIRLAALCGLLLGTHGWGAVVLGAAVPWLLSAVVAAGLLKAKRVRRRDLIPLGPYLIAGALLSAILTQNL
jgi:leader peptidase (prepilin peptidase) / N-methyltransferase